VATTPPDPSDAQDEVRRIPFRLRSRTEEGAEAPSAPDEEALAAFRQAAWLNPDEADYHYILGDALLRARRFTEAATAFEEATWRAATDAQYQLGLGIALHALKRDAEAASAFREAARLAPAEPRARGGLGVSLATLGQLAEGIRELRQAVVLAPADADAHFNLGLALAASGQVEDAHDSLLRATTLAPSDAWPRAELGVALHDLARHAEAHSAFGEALRLDPRCLDAQPRLRTAYEASSMAALKEGIRSDVARSRSASGWALRPLVVVMERLPSFPRGLGTALTIVLLGLATYVTVRMFGPYWNHYTFRDEIAEIGHAPLRDDTEIRSRILEAAERHHLARYVQEGQLTIDTRRTWRRITCRYAVPVAIVPGFVSSLRFSLEVEEPVLIDGEEKIFF
jgi:Flp pilus assembly protein TadD